MIGRLEQSHFAVIPARALPGSPEESGEGPESTASHGHGDGAENAHGAGGSPGFDVRFRDGLLLVSQVDEGGAAARAGVQPGWVLVRGGDEDVAEEYAETREARPDLDDRDLAFAMRRDLESEIGGDVGTSEEFVFLDADDNEVALTLEREELGVISHDFGTGLPTFHLRFHDEIITRDDLRVGRIHFTNWFLPMMRPIDEAIDRMRDADGIVIDLRGNSGGAGAMVMGLAGHFFTDRRELGTQTMRDGKMTYIAMPRFVNTESEAVQPYAGPLAILIDETSASASEVFSGGVQSTGRARVFGETSAGAVLPARTTMLPNGDALLHALGDFKTSTGITLEERGVVPDEVVRLTRDDLLAGRDAQLEAALAWIAAQPRP